MALRERGDRDPGARERVRPGVVVIERDAQVAAHVRQPVGRTPQAARARRTVHTNGAAGASRPAAAQHASSTRRSKAALCATR